jgi:hypothetical protein
MFGSDFEYIEWGYRALRLVKHLLGAVRRSLAKALAIRPEAILAAYVLLIFLCGTSSMIPLSRARRWLLVLAVCAFAMVLVKRRVARSLVSVIGSL